MNEKITIPEWHDMAQNGVMLTMRIPIHGVSMYPLVRMDRDLVTISPLKERPEAGDIVLFAEPRGERYVLHRVWKAEDNRVLTWGDNCDRPDGWLPWDIVWGKAELIERGRLTIHPDPKKGLVLAGIWHGLGRNYRRCRRLAGNLRSGLKRLVNRRAGHDG